MRFTNGGVFAAAILAAMSAHAAPGDLDTSFGTGGTASVGMGGLGYDSARGVMVDAAGRLVVVGSAETSQSTDFAVLRLLANGQTDATFGTGGKLLFDLHSSSYDVATGYSLDGVGKIYVGGFSRETGSTTTTHFAMSRVTTTGGVDVAFGDQGHTFVDNPTTGNDVSGGMALDAIGNAYLVGNSAVNNLQTLKIAKFTPAGQNATWGNQGTYTTTNLRSAATTGVSAIADASGALYVAASVSNGNSDIALVKYDNEGNLDDTFHEHGASYADHDSYDSAAAMTRDAKGNFIIVGRTGLSPELLMIAKFDKTGTLVPTFGTGGVAALSLPNRSTVFPNDVKADADGNLYIAASTSDPTYAVAPAMVAVDGATGTLRSDFGTQGYSMVAVTFTSSAQGIALDPAHQRACMGHVHADTAPPSYFNVTCFKTTAANEIFAADFE